MPEHIEKNIDALDGFSRTIEMDCPPEGKPTVTISTFAFDIATNLKFTFSDVDAATAFYMLAERIENIEDTERTPDEEYDEESFDIDNDQGLDSLPD